MFYLFIYYLIFHQYLNVILFVICFARTDSKPINRQLFHLPGLPFSLTPSLFTFSGVPGTVTSLYWEADWAAAFSEVSKQLLMEFCCLVVSAGLLLLFLLLLHFINILLFWRGDRGKNEFIDWNDPAD